LFVFTSQNINSQSRIPNSEPTWDSLELEGLKEIGFYFNKTDLIDSRIDTLDSNIKQIRTLDDDRIIEEQNNLITFYEYENLLVLNSNSDIEKKFLFLTFLYEEGTPYHSSRHFLSDKGERIVIEYKSKNSSEKKMFFVSIYYSQKNDYLVTHFD
jgi:hypothetical protein